MFNLTVKAITDNGEKTIYQIEGVTNIEHKVKNDKIFIVVCSGKWIVNQFKIDTVLLITDTDTSEIYYKKL